MKPNRDMIIGAVVVVISLIYWVGWGQTPFRDLPLVWRFSFKLLPGMNVLIPVVGLVTLGKGILQARQEQASGSA